MERIMFIDDDPMLLRMAGFMMKKCGRQALTAASGDEGVALIKSEHPQMIFLDAEMPEKNGLETLEQIKNDSETAFVPVCIMSGTITDELREKSQLLGAIGLIEKPLQVSQVLEVINKVTGKE